MPSRSLRLSLRFAAAVLGLAGASCQLVLDPATYITRDAAPTDAQGAVDVHSGDGGLEGAVMSDAVAMDAPEVGVVDAAPGRDVTSSTDGTASADGRSNLDVTASSDAQPDDARLPDATTPPDANSDAARDVSTVADAHPGSDVVSATDARPDVGCGTCATGTTCCGTTCVDLASSVDHCGMCGAACPTGAVCTGGTCACSGGRLLCTIDSTQRCCMTLCLLAVCL